MTAKKYSLVFALLLSASVGAAADFEPAKPVELAAPADLRDANTLQAALNDASAKVMDCVRSKLAPAGDCRCLYPAALARLRKIFEATLLSHPAWHDRVISWPDAATHAYSYTLSLKGLRIELFGRPCSSGKTR